MVSGQGFTGEYRHQIDDKGRIAVPSKMRALLAGPIFVSRWLDACLAILPGGEWDAITEKVAGLPMTDPAARALERRLFGGAVEAELDRQGRILIPENLRHFAGLEGEVIVVGSRSHAEIWAPARWDAQTAMLDDDAAFGAAISGLRI
ncbi:MAG: division/cell wall cluster transcriptional repressor MraZ [Candidatus Limnocylindrales bacterium]